MQDKILHLKDVIDIDIFQKIQDDIAKATEMAVITVDYKGRPASVHSKCSEFCKIIRSDPKYSQLCEKCDSRGGLEAARLEKPYVYICHAGLIDFATPIIVNGQYLGAVMAGQVLIKEEEKNELEVILDNKFCKIDLENGDRSISESYSKLPVVSLDKIKAVAQMMFHISNYIVGEAVLKMAQEELNEKNIKFIQAKKAQAELEREFKASELKALQSQINPHFLFNVLNSISSLALVEKAPKTQEVIYNLSNLLRYTLRKVNKVVALGEAINYIESYLRLQKVRYADRLQYDINIGEETKAINIPFMILQPFVENAIVHGLEKKEEGGFIKIYEEDLGSHVVLSIEDNGIGITKDKLDTILDELKSKETSSSDRIGINNVNRRMYHHYGEEYDIDIISRIRKGTIVKITIPKEH